MSEFFSLLALILLIVYWINQNDINEDLRREIVSLKNRLNHLNNNHEITEPFPETQNKSLIDKPKQIKSPEIKKEFKSKTKTPNTNVFEQLFGTSLAIWVGGIALAFAGFYLIKYSIEQNLLSPTVRVILGGVFSTSLLLAGEYIRRKIKISNGLRISQTLTGAGVAILYGVFFASSNLYSLIPSYVAFIGMTLVTLLAITLSILHGPAIGLLGMFCGYLAPALLGSSNPSAPLLFSYLYMIFAVLMILIKRQDWWNFSLFPLLGVFSWALVWLIKGPTQSVYLNLYLMAISGTIIAVSISSWQKASNYLKALNYAGIGLSMALMVTTSAMNDYSSMDWMLYGLLSIGGIIIAAFFEKEYMFVPWLAMIMNLVMISQASNKSCPAFLVFVFALIFGASGYFLLFKALKKINWVGIAGSASLLYYLIGFYKFKDLNYAWPLQWGLISIVLSLVAAFIFFTVLKRSMQNKEKVLGILAITASSLIACGLSIELTEKFIALALALECLAIAWINTKIRLKTLNLICAGLGIAYGVSLILQLLTSTNDWYSIKFIDSPFIQLIIPAFCALGTSYFLLKENDSRLVRGFEYVSSGILALGLYVLCVFHFEKLSFAEIFKGSNVEASLATNLLFLLGLVCLIFGRKFNRKAFGLSGLAIYLLASFRLLTLDIIIDNPLWSSYKVIGWPLINTLIIFYALPAMWLKLASNNLNKLSITLSKYLQASRIILSFLFINLNVRYLFHSPFLNAGGTTQTEIYIYSFVWLVLGLFFLTMGIIQNNQTLRLSSLLIMLLTVGKVFIIDASNLEGLTRVLSFFALGLSLIGLGYFYSKYVFNKDEN